MSINLLNACVFCCGMAYFTSVTAAIQVDLEGVDGELKANVLALLSLQQYSDHPLGPSRVRHYHRLAVKEIQQALEPFGYYRVSVAQALKKSNGDWQATYVIDPGPQLSVTAMDVQLLGEGAGDAVLQAILAPVLKLKGEPVLHSHYDSAKRALIQKALSLGYLDARYLVSRLEINAEAATVTVRLHLDVGRRYRIGAVRFSGSDLKPELLRAYIPFEKDVHYSARDLLDLRRALEDSDYFADVRVAVNRDEVQAGVLPVDVQLTPRKPNRYSVGFGFGTDTGARGHLGWANRRINRSGHQVELEYRLSEIDESYTGRYRVPLARARTDFLEFHSLFGREDSDTTDSTIASLGATLSTVRNQWRRALALTWQQEDFDIGDTQGDSGLLIPSVSYTRVWRPNRLIVDEGFRLQAGLKGASRHALSDEDFLQARFDGKWVQRLGEGSRLISRGTVGATWVEDFDRLPPRVRFFAGGDRSVRGFDYNDLGPRDASGQVIGGRYLAVASVEYEHRIRGNWAGAVFLDAGNAFEQSRIQLARGAGVGLRWRSPIGMVRLDVAAAISEADNPVRLHLTVGPDL